MRTAPFMPGSTLHQCNVGAPQAHASWRAHETADGGMELQANETRTGDAKKRDEVRDPKFERGGNAGEAVRSVVNASTSGRYSRLSLHGESAESNVSAFLSSSSARRAA